MNKIKRPDKDKSKDTKNNYPVSINNQQCIGPCYYTGTQIIHPLTLDEISNIDYHFCPVNAFPHKDPITKKIRLEIIDKCIVPTARETQMDETLSENIIVPRFHFSSDYFIKVYYKIFNLEELLRWLDEHKNDPFKTKERVFNNGMAVYGDQLTIIDHRLVYFVNDVMNEYLPKIYKQLKKYIIVIDDKITLVEYSQERKTSNDDSLFLVRGYIKSKFLGTDNITQFMSKFVRYYKAELSDRFLSHHLVNHMVDYCIKRIKMTLEQTTDLPLDMPFSQGENVRIPLGFPMENRENIDSDQTSK